MLVITRRQGEAIVIGKDIEVLISEVSGDKVKVCIDAPREKSIMRKELLETSQMNEEAVKLSDGNSFEQFKSMAKVMEDLKK